jgi:hypothetical protein
MTYVMLNHKAHEDSKKIDFFLLFMSFMVSIVFRTVIVLRLRFFYCPDTRRSACP